MCFRLYMCKCIYENMRRMLNMWKCVPEIKYFSFWIKSAEKIFYNGSDLMEISVPSSLAGNDLLEVKLMP